MAAEKDAELMEVTHSVSIPMIRVPRSSGQVYRDKKRLPAAVTDKIKVNGYKIYLQK